MQIPSHPIVTVFILLLIHSFLYDSLTVLKGFLLAVPILVKLLATWLIPKPDPPASTLTSILLVFKNSLAYSSTNGFTPLEPTHEIVFILLKGMAKMQMKLIKAPVDKTYKEFLTHFFICYHLINCIFCNLVNLFDFKVLKYYQNTLQIFARIL